MSSEQLWSQVSSITRLNMSNNNFASKSSRFQSHSHNNSDTTSKALSKRGKSSKNAPEKAELPNHTIRAANTRGSLAALSAPPLPALQRKPNNTESKRISALASDLETFLRKRGRDEILTARDLRNLWSASREPPITRKTLSELDLQNLRYSLYLRHDLNFDQGIQFSPRSASVPGGKEKQIEAQRYWEAIEIELALYTSYLKDLRLNLRSGSLLDAHCFLPTPRSLSEVLQRLEFMIQAIGRIVKTLVPPTKQPLVDIRLNPTLFIQELEHGQCDVEDLFNWLGALLLESCAPSRDRRISCVIKTISQGSRDEDSQMLCRGFQDLFCVLEIMKLDAANYQLQLSRDLMLSRSVDDERDQIIWRMQSGWEVPNWLDDTVSSKISFALFTTKLISLIIHPNFFLPTALALDHARIYKLQITFQLLTFQAACRHALSSTLHFLGWIGPAPESSQNDIASLISAIEQDPTLDLADQRESLVLGIASQAYKLCAKKGTPNPSALCHTRNALCTATEAASLIGNGNTVSLSAQLTKAVEKELETVKGMDAMQLARRYTSNPTSGALMIQPPAPQASLEDMARKITHIAILHWRVWAPILYSRLKDDKGRVSVDDAMPDLSLL